LCLAETCSNVNKLHSSDRLKTVAILMSITYATMPFYLFRLDLIILLKWQKE